MSCFDIRQPSIEALRAAPVYFRYVAPKNHRVLVDGLTAQAILAVYDAPISPEARAKLERMIAASPAQLGKVADFAFKHVSF